MDSKSSFSKDDWKVFPKTTGKYWSSVISFNSIFEHYFSTDNSLISKDGQQILSNQIDKEKYFEALNKLTERYLKVGKKVHLKHLSQDCRRLLANADQLIDVNIVEDPSYKVLTNA